jgi:hypothetical protein
VHEELAVGVLHGAANVEEELEAAAQVEAVLVAEGVDARAPR